MDIFDFAEDWLCEGEPDLPTFLLIHEQRRDYFWEVQKKVASTERLDSSTLPPKDSDINGIRWLLDYSEGKSKTSGELPLKPCFVVEETAIFSIKIIFTLLSS